MKLIFILFFALSAQAGIRVVGKGGGYGEMQAVFINMRMNSLVQSCLHDPSACHLSLSESLLVTKAATLPFDLVLDPSCGEPEIKVLSKQKATLSSCALYTEGNAFQSPSVRAFKEIASLILTARLLASQNTEVVEAKAMAQNVFANFVQNEDSLAVVLNSGNFLAHTLSIEYITKKQIIFSLEGTLHSVDVTELVLANLQCPSNIFNTLSITLENATSLDDDKGLIASDVEWACNNGPLIQGTLQVFFETKSGEILAPSIQVRVVNKHKAPAPSLLSKKP